MAIEGLTLHVIRHGQTEDNVVGRWTGRNDLRLPDLGRHNAREYGEILKSLLEA
jgi:broad specificity phosphatase PhoE